MVVPQLLTQFLARDDVAVILKKAGKNAKRLVLQLDADPVFAKLCGSKVHFKHAEAQCPGCTLESVHVSPQIE
jgi:hypothetical protein